MLSKSLLGISNLISKRLISCILLTFFISASLTLAKQAAPEKPVRRTSTHPHCGLYCLYSVFKLEGKQVNFKNLIKPEYLGSIKGSSMTELEQAAKDFGLNVAPLGRLTTQDLKSITSPAILHVKSSIEKKDYDHFVLYMGNRDGKALIFDPPGEPTLVEFGQVAPIWDGNALVVSSRPLSLSQLASLSQKRLAIYAFLSICVILVFHFLKRFIPITMSFRLRTGYAFGQAGGLVIIAVFAGLLCNYFYDGGFFANASAVAGVQEAHAGNFIAKISPEKMQKIAGQSNVVILDARFKRDYKAGHIEGAINLPVNCSDEEYKQIISGLSKDNEIVLYCQSAGCPFAEKKALLLKEDGFKNLSVFKGGWVEWQKLNKSLSVKAEGENHEKNKS